MWADFYLYALVTVILGMVVLLTVSICVWMAEKKRKKIRVPITSIDPKHIMWGVKRAQQKVGEEIDLRQMDVGGWFASTKTYGPCHSSYPLEALYKLEMLVKEKQKDVMAG